MLSNDGGFKKKERWNRRKRYGMRPTLDSLANALCNAPMTRRNISLDRQLTRFFPAFIYIYSIVFGCYFIPKVEF